MIEIFIKQQGFLICCEVCENLNVDSDNSGDLKVYYKHVNNMLNILQRHGIYSMFFYLEARNNKNKFTIEIMQALNLFILKAELGEALISSSGEEQSVESIFPDRISPGKINNIRKNYGKVFLSLHKYSEVCTDFLKDFLEHLKLELKSGIKGQGQ